MGTSEHRAHDAAESEPLLLLRGERALALGRERVDPATPLSRRRFPLTANQRVGFEAMQRRVERAGGERDFAVGALLQPVDDGVAVQRAALEGREQHRVEVAFERLALHISLSYISRGYMSSAG